MGSEAISSVYWRTSEEDTFRTYYPLMGSRVAKLLPGRTPGALRRKAIRLEVSTELSLVASRRNHNRYRQWRENNPALAVFESHFTPITETGCWVWLASVTRNGYGIFCYGGKCVSASRWALENYLGVTKNLPRRSCGQSTCVNPWHMRQGAR